MSTEPEIVVLVDLSNIIINVRELDPNKFNFNIETAFKELEEWLKEEDENIVFFCFGTQSLIPLYLASFEKQGYFPITCDLVNGKETTDTKILQFVDIFLVHPVVECICIVSGDEDFLPAVRKIAKKGKRVRICAANRKSLSRKLAKEMGIIYPSQESIHILQSR